MGFRPPATGEWYSMVACERVSYPQHPEKKQRMRLKKPHRWGVCGVSAVIVVSDDTMVTGTSSVLVSLVFISCSSISSAINNLSSASV